jgi:acyl homoserine lactone synthase
MISFLYSNNLKHHPLLKHTMFRDRAEQFSTRLGWDVSVTKTGEERDQYDDLNPLYVIVSNPDGSHAGSMRFLPTTGRTMVNEHFRHLTDGVKIHSPFIWECTRFCISPRANRTTATMLMAAGGKLMNEVGLKHFVGVFDQRMERVYRWIGSSPTVLGRAQNGSEKIGVGLWEYDEHAYTRMLARARMSFEEMELYFVNSIEPVPQMAEAG